MPLSDSSFADILSRADTLASAITSFTPTFAPPDATLVAGVFTSFVNGLRTLSNATNTAHSDYSTATVDRLAMVKDLKTRAMRAMRYVQSNAAWASNASSLKLTYDKLRNNRTARKKLPTSGSVAEVKKAIKTGEQSFGDLDALFTRFVVGLSKIVGYNPPATELTLMNMQTLNTNFTAKNKTLAGLAETAALQVRARLTGFADLKNKARSIKNAVGSQYGMQSAQYTSIKGLAF